MTTNPQLQTDIYKGLVTAEFALRICLDYAIADGRDHIAGYLARQIVYNARAQAAYRGTYYPWDLCFVTISRQTAQG